MSERQATPVSDVLSGARRRARAVSRRAAGRARPVARAAASRVAGGARALPVPTRVRVGVSKALLRKPRPLRVPIDSLLQGAQAGVSATRYAELTGDLLWPSRRIVDGAHAALLRLSDGRGTELTDAEILGTAYADLARRAIAARGAYFAATDDAGVVALARDFIARHRGTSAGSGTATAYRSTPNDPVLVAPVRWSECYQVLDGHHRLAQMAVRGETYADVTVKRVPVTTPLQDLLNRMSWLEGSRELYQPLDAPELRQSWATVRRCTDRRDKMLAFLGERGWLPPEAATYLDVACFYGWFVSEMQHAGFTARGIERDPLARQVGHAMYGLDPALVEVGNAEDLLPSTPVTDVVSCFSLLHHFVLGRASVDAATLVGQLSAVTGRVLFLDTGQEHEAWFRDSLTGWDTAAVESFLREHGGFAEVIDLGPDADAVPPYEKNYGRHLFACVKGTA